MEDGLTDKVGDEISMENGLRDEEVSMENGLRDEAVADPGFGKGGFHMFRGEAR